MSNLRKENVIQGNVIQLSNIQQAISLVILKQYKNTQLQFSYLSMMCFHQLNHIIINVITITIQ